jgi:acyl-CoA reductase-like NAD-dependent aldehyde dehydrogenase
MHAFWNFSRSPAIERDRKPRRRTDPAGSGESVELVDPATGKVFLTYADAGPAVIDAAMNAAQEAQARWTA